MDHDNDRFVQPKAKRVQSELVNANTQDVVHPEYSYYGQRTIDILGVNAAHGYSQNSIASLPHRPGTNTTHDGISEYVDPKCLSIRSPVGNSYSSNLPFQPTGGTHNSFQVASEGSNQSSINHYQPAAPSSQSMSSPHFFAQYSSPILTHQPYTLERESISNILIIIIMHSSLGCHISQVLQVSRL